MNTLVLSLVGASFIGFGATLTFDAGSLVLKHIFKIAPSNICLVGRWIRYMPEGTFIHSNLGAAPRKSGECAVGWMAHYTIGVMFALAFVALAGNDWLRHPTPAPAILFGVVTVLAPLLVMQPAFGSGVAASKTPNPIQARFRSLTNHISFGVGLYLFGLIVSWLLMISGL